MSAYATQQDMIDRFGTDEVRQLSDRSGSGSIDGTVVDQALADASDQIDSYIGGRYTLPLNHVPPVLTRVCVDIARYQLYDIAAPEQIAERYKANLQWLTQVAKGTVRLGLDSAETAPASSDSPELNSAGHVWSRSDKSFI